MPKVITEGSTVKCSTQGTVQLIAGQSKLKVGGAKVLVDGDLSGAPIAGCLVPVSQTTSPCATVTAVLAGPATKLKVGGKAVLLETTTGSASGLAPAPETFSVQSAGQSKLNAV